ncbi:MAG: hypothetical protein IPO83_04895 [Chitinophagaceae bacterium]|nr:hypothetical protein [Chitinophagaceae bacterium]
MIVSVALMILLAVSCDNREVVNVTRVGELEKLIRDGDLTTHAKLKELTAQPNLYAIGNTTNNEGFITVINGKCYASSVDTARQLMIDSSCNSEATLLLYSNVTKWKQFEIPADIVTLKQLEQFISNMAAKYNVSKTAAFCFRLNGTAAAINWHVVKWRANMKEITYKKMHTLGLTGSLTNEPVEVIGFYSKESKEIFVHQETVLNMHFVNHDHSIAARIEDIKLDGRMKLYLPESSPE